MFNLKKSSILLTAMLGLLEIQAQDVIVKKDGSTILSKVLEINPQDIKYKKFSNLNGPTYSINKSEILSVNYENGEKDLFTEESTQNTSQSENVSKCITRRTDEKNNSSILSSYNQVYEISGKNKEKNSAAKSVLMIFGVKQSSVMSNEDIEIKFKRERVNIPTRGKSDVYYIIIKNKTNRTLYIDRGNSFKVLHDGTAESYFDNSEQVTISSGGSHGGSLGLGSVAGALGIGGTLGQLAGGIRVGASSSRTMSTTYVQQRFIGIPPMGTCKLSDEKWVKSKDGSLLNESDYKNIERAESFNLYHEKSADIGLQRGFIKTGQVRVCQEDEIPWHRDYYITYSTDEDFKTYSSIHFTMYIHQIVGLSRNWVLDDIIYKYVKGLNEFTIAGCHWTDKD